MIVQKGPVDLRNESSTLAIIGSGNAWPNIQQKYPFDHDLARLKKMSTHFDVCCINHSGSMFEDNFHLWFSQHIEELHKMPCKHPLNSITKITVATKHFTHFRMRHWNTVYSNKDMVWVFTRIGDSGLIAALLAIKMWGYKRIVMVGCPINNQHSDYITSWLSQEHFLKNRVKSMSGRTRDLLGFPEKQWLL